MPHLQEWYPIVFSFAGDLAITDGAMRWYNDLGRTLTFQSVRASVGTAPTTQSILCDVNVNGTTIWSTQANRVAVAAAANTGESTTFNTTTITDGQYLEVDIDQVGSGTVGADLTVTIWVKD